MRPLLSVWFRERVGNRKGRIERIAIVAMARFGAISRPVSYLKARFSGAIEPWNGSDPRHFVRAVHGNASCVTETLSELLT
jgi:hypothetical protein